MNLSGLLNHRVMLELLTSFRVRSIDVSFHASSGAFRECFHSSRYHRSQLPIDPSASDLVGSSSMIDRCAVIFHVPYSERKIVGLGASQSSLSPLGPGTKVRTTRVLMATAVYAMLYARGVLSKPPTSKGTAPVVPQNPKTSRSRPVTRAYALMAASAFILL